MGEGPIARFKRVKKPVARQEDLFVERVADETVVYDDRTKEAHCLSPLAAVVFDRCDGETTIEELAQVATERLGEPVEEAHVIDALIQLQDCDLLAQPPRGSFTRRKMLEKSAAVAGSVAFAGPLITTIMAPSPAAALTTSCAQALCCPCCTRSDYNKGECCLGFNQCVCVVTRAGDITGRGTKWCTPASSPGVNINDAFCLAYPATLKGCPTLPCTSTTPSGHECSPSSSNNCVDCFNKPA